MNRPALALVAAALAVSCTTIEPVSEDNRTLAFECDETVVIGRVSNQVAQPVAPIEGDIIGHGWIDATLHVDRTVQGDNLSGELDVRYFAHTFMRDDRRFMFVLSKGEEGYEIETAQLMSANPRAVSVCRETPGRP